MKSKLPTQGFEKYCRSILKIIPTNFVLAEHNIFAVNPQFQVLQTNKQEGEEVFLKILIDQGKCHRNYFKGVATEEEE